MIARIKVTDPEQFAVYAKIASVASANFGARSIVRGGRYETMEGDESERNVVLEFDSFEKAREY